MKIKITFLFSIIKNLKNMLCIHKEEKKKKRKKKEKKRGIS